MDNSYYIEDDNYWFVDHEPYLQKAIKARNEAYMLPCSEIPLGEPEFCVLGSYKSGDLFKNRNRFYILAQVDSETFALISLQDGDRWSNPLKSEEGEMFIKDYQVHITQSLFDKLCEGNVLFERIGCWDELMVKNA